LAGAGSAGGGSFWPRLAALLLLAALASAVWIHRLEIARPGERLAGPQLDSFLYFYPSAVFISRELHDGRLPLWNPYQMAGQPYLALHVPAVLYPPNLVLFGLLGPRAALAANAVLHLFIGGLFTWLFAGRLGLGAPARLLAAFGFMLAGGVRVGIYVPPFIATPVWLPAIVWAIHGMAATARPRWSIALAAFLALAFLGGHAQGFVYLVQLGALYAAFALVFVAPPGRRLAVVAQGLLAGVLALGWMAPQLLPALELVQGSVRGFAGVEYWQGSLSMLTPETMRAGLLPFCRSDAQIDALDLAAVPVLTLPLLALGALARGQRAHWLFFAAGSLLLGLFMLGHLSWVFPLYYELPLGNLFRAPNRMAFAYAFALSLAAAIGLDGAERLLRGRRVPAWLPAALAGAVLLVFTGELYAQTRAVAFDHPAVSEPDWGSPPALGRFLHEQTGRDRVFVDAFAFDLRILSKLGMLADVFALPDYEPNMPGVYARLLEQGNGEVPWHGDLFALDDPHPWKSSHRAPAAMLDLMSVRWYAVPTPAYPELRAALQRHTSGTLIELAGALVGERKSALPRVYALRSLRFEPDFDAALARLHDPAFDPHREVVVTDPEREAGSLEAGDAGGAGAERAEITAYAPCEVVIRASCAAACTVVLTDLFYPGWRLYVDGAEQPILPVNALFRGARLSAGDHELVYRYQPGSFRLGLLLFAHSCLLALFVARFSRGRDGS
jgi:hypothetical protein